MSDQKPLEVYKKIEQIYDNFGLDIEDMESDEIDRMAEYYDLNRDQLEKDYKKSLLAKKIISDREADSK
jgi:hypothetical protein